MTTTLDLDFTVTTTLDPRITFSRASSGTYYNAAGLLVVAATNVPRFDYDPVTHAAKGLLIEGARNNELWWSQDLSNAVWTKTGATIAVDQIVAPDGTTTADRVTASASPATISESPGSTGAAINYVASIYAKKGTSDWIYLIAQVTASTPRCWFNLATGAVGTVESPITSATIQDVGNGWYHCKFLRPTAAGNLFVAGICDGDNSTTVTVGRTVHLWGAQLESLVAPDINHSSYIPTVGADGVRAADIATMTGSNFSDWYNQAGGTFAADFELLATNFGTRPVLSADNGTANERILLYAFGSDPKVTVTDGGVVQADLDLGTV